MDNERFLSGDSYSASTSSDEYDYRNNYIDHQGELLHQNKYLIIFRIGFGAYSSVWLSYNIQDKNFYAIKIHNPEDFDEGDYELELLQDLKKHRSDPGYYYLNTLIEHFVIYKKVEKKKTFKAKKLCPKSKTIFNSNVYCKTNSSQVLI